MSYGGRRSQVNVTQYIAQLNTVQPEDSIDSPTGLEDDLALFTNANEFMNWDGPSAFEPNPAPFDVNFDQSVPAVAGTNITEPKMDFRIPSNFDFGDFSGFQSPIVDQSLSSLPPQPHHNAYPIAPSFTSPTDAVVSPVTPGFDGNSTATKRKLSTLDGHEQFSDEAARQAAEEDKRRRNTAASARFRIKKKQREQQLEKTAKEMSDRVAQLETKLQQLERENTWLKGLITEKNGGKSTSELSALIQKKELMGGDRIGETRDDGVGTEAKAEGEKA